MNAVSATRRPTTTRAVIAVMFSAAADLLQFLLGPLGWFGTDPLIDVAAMIFTILAIGFHILLLPTFVLEFIPAVNALPTWTACTLAVIALRKGRERSTPPGPSAPPPPRLNPPG